MRTKSIARYFSSQAENNPNSCEALLHKLLTPAINCKPACPRDKHAKVLVSPALNSFSCLQTPEKCSLFSLRFLLQPLRVYLSGLACSPSAVSSEFIRIIWTLTLRRLMSYIYIYIYGAHILDVSRSHTTTQHSR